MRKIFAVVLLLASARTVRAQAPEAVMERAAKAYTDLKSLRAEFRQSITNPLTGTNSLSRGILVRKDPDLLAINFTDPKGDRIVADGKSLWIYLPSSAPGQVIRTEVGRSGSMQMIDPGVVFLSSPASRYYVTGAGTATLGGRKMNVVNLVPRKPNGTFTRAKVWVDASTDMIRQFEVVDANGLTRFVTITEIHPNATVAASEFRFLPPKNARILDSPGM